MTEPVDLERRQRLHKEDAGRDWDSIRHPSEFDEEISEAWPAILAELEAARKPVDDETVETMVERLREFAQAYPDDIFLPLTDEQKREHPLVITRASAQMGRHLSKWFDDAASLIERLARKPVAQGGDTLLKAAIYVRDDLKMRADMGDFNGDHTIAIGDGAWQQLNAAIDAAIAQGKAGDDD